MVNDQRKCIKPQKYYHEAWIACKNNPFRRYMKHLTTLRDCVLCTKPHLYCTCSQAQPSRISKVVTNMAWKLEHIYQRVYWAPAEHYPRILEYYSTKERRMHCRRTRFAKKFRVTQSHGFQDTFTLYDVDVHYYMHYYRHCFPFQKAPCSNRPQ